MKNEKTTISLDAQSKVRNIARNAGGPRIKTNLSTAEQKLMGAVAELVEMYGG